MKIGNPKKFQRKIFDVANKTLTDKNYFFSKKNSKTPFLKPNGIANIADFHGRLCFVKEYKYHSLTFRIGAALLIGLSMILFFGKSFPPNPLGSDFFVGIIVLIIGIVFFFIKFSKKICITISLIGESYRENYGDELEDLSESLCVTSDARIIVKGSPITKRNSLSNFEKSLLIKDSEKLLGGLDSLLENYLENNTSN